MVKATTLEKGRKQWIATLQVLVGSLQAMVATFMKTTPSEQEMMPNL